MAAMPTSHSIRDTMRSQRTSPSSDPAGQGEPPISPVIRRPGKPAASDWLSATRNVATSWARSVVARSP